MFFQKEKHISWVSVCHGPIAKNQSFHTSSAEWGNWHASTVHLYLSSQHLTGIIILSLICFPVSEIMVSASCLSEMKTALQPCTLCLGQETAALELFMTDPEATAVMSHWHRRMTWVIPWTWCLDGQQTQKAAAAALDPAASATMQGILTPTK